MRGKIYLLFILLFFLSKTGYTQSWKGAELIVDSVYTNMIGSVKLHQLGDPLAQAVIQVNSQARLKLSFDYLSQDIPELNYTIVHCNSKWELSKINSFDYLDGFNENSFYNYDFSINTIQPYVHYELEFPNNDISPKISGNYLMVVFKENNPDSVLFTKRFYVVETRLGIDAYTKQPGSGKYYQSHQEVIFEINYKDFELRNPFQELEVSLLQNWRLDNAYNNIQPVFVKEERLIYRQESKYVFPAHKEYRFFDTRNLRLLDSEVKTYNLQRNKIELFPDQVTVFKEYFYSKDINLKYINDIKDFSTPELRADYNKVKFMLATNTPYSQGDIYIFGELSNWQIDKRFKMKYNFETKAYEGEVLLKQGFYNYAYNYLKKGEKVGDTSYFDGNHFEAENDYYIFAYYKGMGDRYQRIIGFDHINSLKRK